MNDVNPQPTRQSTVIALLALLSLYLIAYLLPLGGRDLFVPDETRYAVIPHEMIDGGDWIVPHLNGLRYFEKPPLGYWLYAGALLLFGENNFAVRLPSALAVGLSALLIFFMVKKARLGQSEAHSHSAPITASLVFLSCLAVFGTGTIALLDSLFSFFLTACIAAFYAATEARPGSAKEKGWLLMAGMFCGLAFLTKGFLAFAVPILALVPYLLWQRRYADILRMSWLPIAIAVLVILPWALCVHLREPDFWNFFFWHEHIRRFAASDAQHKQSFWFFLLAIPGMVFPWTCMTPAAALGIKKLWREQPEWSGLLKLCLCWMIVPLLFFSASSGKLLTYILPCFPPFAILTGLGLLHAFKHKGKSKLFQGGVMVNGLLFAMILVAFMALQLFDFRGFRPYSHPWQVIMIIGGLLFCIALHIWSYRSTVARTKIILSGMALIFIYFIAPYSLPDDTREAKCPGEFLRRNSATIDKNDIILADEESITAVCWHLQRRNIYVLGPPGELAYGFGHPDAHMRLLDLQSAAERIRQHRGETVLIARARNYNQWQDKLPPASVQDQNGDKGYVVVRFL
ncbi:MAG: phospholipid carrier-dependent glycosyltransferase [Desulfobulbus sp.]|nr:phospholipid carrier-dependent glycosyltransferase [Desulfobulbus sp.]